MQTRKKHNEVKILKDLIFQEANELLESYMKDKAYAYIAQSEPNQQ